MTDRKAFNRRDFNELAPTWDDNPHRLTLAKAIVEAISGAVPLTSEMTVLDYGAGTGLVALGLSERVREITAVDASEGMLEVLRGKLERTGISNITLRQLDMEQGEVLNSTFDLVVCSMTLHHIPDAAGMICRFSDMLRSGGWLCVADLDPDGGEFHSDNTGVAHFGFERDAIVQMLTKAGLTEVTMRTALTFSRETASGTQREFSVFLAGGHKAQAPSA
ncbi:MAG: class I SAM-dependent methyltransferase [Armatimonadetes bacterium]|nr:class I SAM-dependent methyltransferase [Armatimonadota bacterium]